MAILTSAFSKDLDAQLGGVYVHNSAHIYVHNSDPQICDGLISQPKLVINLITHPTKGLSESHLKLLQM